MTSAFLDLVSEAWVRGLAARLAAARLGFYASLSYDGALAWTPRLPEDAKIAAALNTDQKRDKGFGPALGPGAVRVTSAAFRDQGYVVRLKHSPWILGPSGAEGQLQAAFLDGVDTAVGSAAPGWAAKRRGHAGTLRVGHLDLLALPPGAAQ